MKPKFVLLIVLILSILLVAGTPAPSGIREMEAKLTESSRHIMPKLTGKICVVDFAEAGSPEYTSEFGQTIANLLSNNFVNKGNKKYQVLERRELIKIMQDKIFFGDSTKSASQLQKNAGMDVLVTGDYGSDSRSISVRIKAVDANNGRIIASSALNIKRTNGLDKMMKHRFRYFGGGKEDTSADKYDDKSQSPDVLELETGIFYEGSDRKLNPVREGMVLTSKDNYAIYVKANRACYLYIYQIDSSGKTFKIFPNKEFMTKDNPLRQGVAYWIPEKDYLFLDENTGKEEIFIFATRQPLKSLENLHASSAPDMEKAINTMGIGGRRGSEGVQKIRSVAGSPVEVISRKIISKGDFFYRVSFLHQ